MQHRFLYIIRYVCILLLIARTTGTAAKDTANDYDSLRRLSSETLIEQGRNHYIQHQPAKALACFTIVSERKVDNDHDLQLQVRALNNCACVYKFYYFDYTQAYNYFIQAYDLCEQIEYDDFLPVIMVNLGDLLNDYSHSYNSKPLFQQAQSIFEKCIEKARDSKNWELLTTAFFNLANQNYTLDLTKYHIILSKEIPDTIPDIAFARLQYQGIQYIQQKNYPAARRCFEQQLSSISTQWAPERDSLAAYMSIATTYRMEQHSEQAIEYLKKALQLAADKDISDLAADLCRQLSELHHQLGQEELSSHYHLQYMEMMEKTHNNQLSHIAELNYIHQLKKEEERAQVLQERQYFQQIFILAILIVLTLVLLFAFLLWQKNRQLKERNKSLYEKNRQLIHVESNEQQLRKAYSKSNLNDEQRESLIYRIQEVLNDADIICQQDFTLYKLAKIINSNTTYVSQVINEKYGIPFSNLLGNYRVKLACQWMDDPKRGNVTIEAIATETGFKSRTAFVNAFKRETGLKPSEYLRMAIEKQA